MGEPRLKSGGRRAKIETGLFAAAVIDLADPVWSSVTTGLFKGKC